MVAGGVLGWTSPTLLAATLPELMFAMQGWRRARGLDPDAGKNTEPMTREELSALIERQG